MAARQKSTSRKKDTAALKIGKRIRQARQMAGFKTQAALNAKLKGWGSSRLGGYEAGYAIPHPNDIELLAKRTGTSACWILFGVGPIRSGNRDLQAVRYQNTTYLYQQVADAPDALAAFLEVTRLDAETLGRFLDNPFKHIGERLARRIEKAGGKSKAWLDTQHVESDGLCASFPDDLRELMTIYSELRPEGRESLLATARALAVVLSVTGKAQK